MLDLFIYETHTLWFLLTDCLLEKANGTYKFPVRQSFVCLFTFFHVVLALFMSLCTGCLFWGVTIYKTWVLSTLSQVNIIISKAYPIIWINMFLTSDCNRCWGTLTHWRISPACNTTSCRGAQIITEWIL